jgi:hypothetical protein
MASSPPQIALQPHMELAHDPRYTIARVHLGKLIASYRRSLFAFEWLTPDGQVKPSDALSPAHAQARRAVETALRQGMPLAMPILGWGMLSTAEIGAGRDVIMTAHAMGIKEIEVHVPIDAVPMLKSIIIPPKDQSGNVLFYILLAIALIAALSYAVQQTSRSGGVAHLSDGQASTMATEILTYGNHVATAVSKLKLRGCTDTQLGMENSVVVGYINGLAPVDESCHVFSPAGGAITWVTPPTGMNNGTPWFISGRTTVHQDSGFASSNAASNVDLVMLLFGLPQALCQKINTRLGVTGIPVNDGNFGDSTQFDGTYSYAEDINGLPEAAQPSPCSAPSTSHHFCGRTAGCFREESGTQRYIFFQVLLQR